MCGRFTLRTPLTVLSQQFLFDLEPSDATANQRPRYNIAPTQQIAAVRATAGGHRRELAWLHWGLVPSWARDAKRAASMINARGETVAEKPSFRTPFARRRCLVLADGYFEWQKVGQARQPYYYRLKSGQPFAFAGLWDSWRAPEGDGPPLESATIITTTANSLAAELHDRMPVILAPTDYDLWLDTDQFNRERLLELLRPYPAEEMQTQPVSRRVNSVRNDDPECVELKEGPAA